MTPFVLPRRGRHRVHRQSVLVVIASVTGLSALALAVAVTFSGLFP